jgi:glycosyltransferase involved in cell wall biosynthesis
VTEPLVTIAIPTFNRAAKLRRAAGSALGQTHAAVEVLISDNASSDETEALCLELARSDQRVRYLRSPVNRGPTANFNRLFAEARGDYVMMLSDDDWLEADYVEHCLAGLCERPGYVLVCAVARYVSDGRVMRTGLTLDLDQEDSRARIVEYLRRVDENGLFYGLMPREVLQRAAPLRNVVGNDWLLVAAVLAQGKAATLTDTAMLRELGGTSADLPKLVATLDLPRLQARLPHLVIAAEVYADIARRADVFAQLPARERRSLARAAARAALDWKADAWHLTMPTFAALGRRRHGRWLWRAYLRVTRLAGATHDGIETSD